MTLESLARTIAKARHGTDAMWANYMGAAEAVSELYARERQAIKDALNTEEDGKALIEVARSANRAEMQLAALLAQPDGAQEGGE